MNERTPILDVLLNGKIRNVQDNPETSDIEVFRLTEQHGLPSVFTVRALTYDQVADLRGSSRMDAEIVLAATISPDFKKDRALAEDLHVLAPGEDWGEHGKMPIDAITALLLPGEIDEISREIQRLTGYTRKMTSIVKKN